MLRNCSTVVSRRLVLSSLLTFACIGCGSGGVTVATTVDETAAKAAFKEFLDAWKEGKKPADLEPKITVNDPAWKNGQKLTSFEIKSGESKFGSALFISAELTLKGGKKPTVVGYQVDTKNDIKISRNAD